MFAFLSVIYVLVCLFLILVVLLQAGKGGGMGSAFGGGSSQTVFGGAGAGNFLTRLTWISAVLFMLLSGTLAYMSTSSDAALRNANEAAEVRRRARDISHTKAPTKAGEMSSPEAAGAAGAAPTAPAAPAAPGAPADPQAIIENTGAAPAAPGAPAGATPQAVIVHGSDAPQAIIENTPPGQAPAHPAPMPLPAAGAPAAPAAPAPAN